MSKNTIFKNIFQFVGLIVGVSLVLLLMIYVFYSQIDYVDLIGKRVTSSDDGQQVLVIDKDDGIVYSYSIEEWRYGAELLWPNYLTEANLKPDDFTQFIAASPLPGDTRLLGFAVSTNRAEDNASVFWYFHIGKRELGVIGEKNEGVVGNIVWSPKETHFSYSLDTEQAAGTSLTVDNIVTKKKKFTITGEDIVTALEAESDDYTPEFRRIRWEDDGQTITFITNGIEEEEVDWSIDIKGENLTKLE